MPEPCALFAGLAVGVAPGRGFVGAATVAERWSAVAVTGRRSTWPSVSWSALLRLLARTRSSTETPLVWAMSQRVSPDLTVYCCAPLLADPAVVAEVAEVAEIGELDGVAVATASVCPVTIMFGSLIEFRLTSLSIGMPVVM